MRTRFGLVLLLPLLGLVDLPGVSRAGAAGGETFDVDEAALKARLDRLASPDLRGREAGTPEGETAARFIAGELEASGLKPFGKDGTFFQPFAAERASFEPGTAWELLDADDRPVGRGTLPDDVLIFTGLPPGPEPPPRTDALVFAGYGITAPEFRYDDYAGVDVRGKMVIALSGEPSSADAAYFAGPERTPHADPNRKISLAASRGAVGLVLLADEEIERAWEPLRLRAARSRLSLAQAEVRAENAAPAPRRDFVMLFAREALVRPAFEREGRSLGRIAAAAADGTAPAGFALKTRSRLIAKKAAGTTVVRNVVAIVEGRDPRRKDEYVVVGAHYDHIGPVGGAVNPGADDNASGTVVAMEVGRVLSGLRRNGRPVLVCLFDAEEAGLLGSRAFVRELPPGASIAAALVLDQVGREAPDRIVCVGPHSSGPAFVDLVRAADEQTDGLEIFWDADREGGLIGGSDHMSFLERKLPALVLTDGFRRQHTPEDTPDRIDAGKLARVARLSVRIALLLANRADGGGGERPRKSGGE